MKYLAILGSTGSIGTQSLEVVREHPDKLKVLSISGHSNINLLEKQIHEFKPKLCAVMDKEKAKTLQSRVPGTTKIISGISGLSECACLEGVDLVITAVSGMIGLEPTVKAIESGKAIALANKETLVAGGDLVMNLVKLHHTKILPVDSEHSAIFQCLQGNIQNPIKRVILTASGGPFRGKNAKELVNVSMKDVLNHPNWSMGKKITVDSATLMNKGLEAIEAKWLFNLDDSQINIVVHPQSIIHSAVEFHDRSVIAQMGLPDMKLPIQYAIFYPNRFPNQSKSLDLTALGALTFEKPDTTTFPCLELALESMSIGKSMPVVLNMANELAVAAFLNGSIGFIDIPKKIESVMKRHQPVELENIETILSIADWTKRIFGSV